MTGVPITEAFAGGRVTIDLHALADNWRTIARQASGAEASAVLKADGYGTGIEKAALTLSRAGCRTFFVALPDEGKRLRSVVPDATIYVLNGLLYGSEAAFVADDLRPVLGSVPEIEAWTAARRSGARVGAAIHVDTGMNRLGLTLAEFAKLAGDVAFAPSLGATLVMSHLACADTPAHPMNAAQLARFKDVAARLPGLPASLANSAGVFLGSEYHFGMVRPGIALYGAKFAEGRPPLRTVVTAEARVLQVREVGPGDSVGYGAAQTFHQPARLAIISAGYADGYHRATSTAASNNPAFVYLHGQKAPLAGRVSMDLIAVDVSTIPGVQRGDWVELFGPNIAVDDVAARSETIGYELLTQLGSRYARRYVGG